MIKQYLFLELHFIQPLSECPSLENLHLNIVNFMDQYSTSDWDVIDSDFMDEGTSVPYCSIDIVLSMSTYMRTPPEVSQGLLSARFSISLVYRDVEGLEIEQGFG